MIVGGEMDKNRYFEEVEGRGVGGVAFVKELWLGCKFTFGNLKIVVYFCCLYGRASIPAREQSH